VSGRYSNNARFGVDYFEAPKHPSLIDSGFPPMTFFRARPGLPDDASPDRHAVADVLRHNISRPNSKVIGMATGWEWKDIRRLTSASRRRPRLDSPMFSRHKAAYNYN
jgi:hypothetical protein